MPFDFSIPRDNAAPLDLHVGAGEIVFLLGANGTGKSTLMHHFYKAHRSNALRITAHRQTWFESNAITLSPIDKRYAENRIRGNDTNPQARWSDSDPSQRNSIAIYDLVEAENIRARKITSAVDSDNFALAKELRKKDAPIKIINDILKSSNITITIEIRDNEEVVASKNRSTTYSIVELSDGERNAILIAVQVLTSKPDTLLLIDEPERHLHRSIISPLLTLLFAKRPDCAFVVSTHEVMLPLDNPNQRTLLIRGCTYKESSVTAWDADLVSSATGIDDDLKRDIFGARRKLLLIEGTERSLDEPLYALVFPDVSIVAKGSCRDVEHAVTNIRDADDLHWLDAFGLVDHDRRTPDEVDQLKMRGVYATAVFSVEGIYYHPEIQRRVAVRHAKVTGDDAGTCIAEAKSAAVDAIAAHAKRLSDRVSEKLIRKEFFGHIPNKEQISAAAPVNFSIDVHKIVQEERTRLQDALDTGDLATLVSRYPVRETQALDKIAQKLGFQNRSQYESAVQKLLMDEADALRFVRSLFGALAADIGPRTVEGGASLADAPSTEVAAAGELGRHDTDLDLRGNDTHLPAELTGEGDTIRI